MKAKCALLSGLLIVSVFAQENIKRKDTTLVEYVVPTVVVTATQAIERVTPATFTNLTREQIQQRYSVQDVPVLLSELPSITFYSENGNGLGYNYINLRGFDQRRLSVMVNGVPQNDPEDHNVYWIDFPDLMASTENIQIQRGAGSAFYGPPAIGGSVNLVTNPFNQKPGVKFESMLGFQEMGQSVSLSTRKYTATINSGLIGKRYMLYARIGRITSTGYRDKGWVDLNSYFLGAVRFDENVTTRFHFFGGPFSDGLVYTGLPKFYNGDTKLRRLNYNYFDLNAAGNSVSYAVFRKPQEIENFSQPHFELLNDWQISSAATLHSTLFYVQGNGFFDYDGDWIWAGDTTGNNGQWYWFSPEAVQWFFDRVGYSPGSVYPKDSVRYSFYSPGPSLLIRGFVGNRQWGWLPRVDLRHERGTLTLGAELRLHRSVHWGKISYGSQLPSSLYDPDLHFYEYNGEKDIFSLYAHELFQLQENLTLMADLQFVYNRYGITHEKYLRNDFSFPYYFLNPRLGLNYNVTDEWNGYLSLAYTSREPRLRNLYAAEDAYFGAAPQFAVDTSGGKRKYDFSTPLVKPEQLLDIEAGVGYHSSTARLGVDLFWMEFTNELVKSGQVDIFGQPVTRNADRTRHIGVEIDGSVKLENTFTVSGNMTISNNRAVTFSFIDKKGKPVSLNGNPLAGFPDVLGNVRGAYDTDRFSAAIVAKYVGSFYTDNFKNNANKNDPYAVLNGELVLHIPDSSALWLTIRGEVRNIFNRLYTMSGEGNAFFPAAERNYLVGLSLEL